MSWSQQCYLYDLSLKLNWMCPFIIFQSFSWTVDTWRHVQSVQCLSWERTRCVPYAGPPSTGLYRRLSLKWENTSFERFFCLLNRQLVLEKDSGRQYSTKVSSIVIRVRNWFSTHFDDFILNHACYPDYCYFIENKIF